MKNYFNNILKQRRKVARKGKLKDFQIKLTLALAKAIKNENKKAKSTKSNNNSKKASLMKKLTFIVNQDDNLNEMSNFKLDTRKMLKKIIRDDPNRILESNSPPKEEEKESVAAKFKTTNLVLSLKKQKSIFDVYLEEKIKYDNKNHDITDSPLIDKKKRNSTTEKPTLLNYSNKNNENMLFDENEKNSSSNDDINAQEKILTESIAITLKPKENLNSKTFSESIYSNLKKDSITSIPELELIREKSTPKSLINKDHFDKKNNSSYFSKSSSSVISTKSAAKTDGSEESLFNLVSKGVIVKRKISKKKKSVIDCGNDKNKTTAKTNFYRKFTRQFTKYTKAKGSLKASTSEIVNSSNSKNKRLSNLDSKLSENKTTKKNSEVGFISILSKLSDNRKSINNNLSESLNKENSNVLTTNEYNSNTNKLSLLKKPSENLVDQYSSINQQTKQIIQNYLNKSDKKESILNKTEFNYFNNLSKTLLKDKFPSTNFMSTNNESKSTCFSPIKILENIPPEGKKLILHKNSSSQIVLNTESDLKSKLLIKEQISINDQSFHSNKSKKGKSNYFNYIKNQYNFSKKKHDKYLLSKSYRNSYMKLENFHKRELDYQKMLLNLRKEESSVYNKRRPISLEEYQIGFHNKFVINKKIGEKLDAF